MTAFLLMPLKALAPTEFLVGKRLTAVDFYCLMSELRSPFPAIAVDILCEISAAGIHLTETA